MNRIILFNFHKSWTTYKFAAQIRINQIDKGFVIKLRKGFKGKSKAKLSG